MHTDSSLLNKKKIINDPVYGLINYPDSKIFDIVEHSWFQRLRHIKQLGLTDLVYPGACHTRFQHAIGAMHLMGQALDVIKAKGHVLTKDESDGAFLAIVLHDIGHGPFSHSLERQIVNIDHEEISLLFMQELNKEFNGLLNTAIDIFTNRYPKKWLHQLVSSQLDVDRLDYLRRDSFFTGVSEGVVSSDRIIMMLDVVDDKLVIEKKGIYSIEKFIIARRLMYWQVYLHKTVHSADQILLSLLERAKYLSINGANLFASPAFKMFLLDDFNINDFKNNIKLLSNFALLDDNDILSSIKQWTKHDDKVLSLLSQKLINRNLFKIIIQEEPFNEQLLIDLKHETAKVLDLSFNEADYFVKSGKIENSAYKQETDKILIKEKNGKLTEIVNVADMLNIRALSNTVSKYFLCFPKNIH